jgi:hypothetical protein
MRDTVEKLMEKYKDTPRVTFRAVDNSLGEGNAKETDIASIPKTDTTNLKGRLQDELDRQHKSGEITDTVYQASRERPPSGRTRGVGGPGNEGDGGEPQQSITEEVEKAPPLSLALVPCGVYRVNIADPPRD